MRLTKHVTKAINTHGDECCSCGVHSPFVVNDGAGLLFDKYFLGWFRPSWVISKSLTQNMHMALQKHVSLVAYNIGSNPTRGGGGLQIRP